MIINDFIVDVKHIFQAHERLAWFGRVDRWQVLWKKNLCDTSLSATD